MFDKLKRVFTGLGPGPNSKVIDDRQSADLERTEKEPKSNYEKWCDENPSNRNCKMYDV